MQIVFSNCFCNRWCFENTKRNFKLSKSQKTKIVRHPNDDMDQGSFVEKGLVKERLTDIDGELLPGIVLTDLWTDISIEGIAKEGGVKFERGKKPEKLFKRIIDLPLLKTILFWTIILEVAQLLL